MFIFWNGIVLYVLYICNDFIKIYLYYGEILFFCIFFRLEFVLIEIKWKDVFYWVDLMKIGWI